MLRTTDKSWSEAPLIMLHNMAWAQVGASGIILVVDDDTAFAEFTRFTVQSIVQCVLLARDGREGIELALRVQPDLIIMNWMMPVMDGLEATKRLRALGYPGRILMDSACSEVAHRVAALNAGANAFISRPSPRAEYVAQVLAAMR